jgi:hypothetical protein
MSIKTLNYLEYPVEMILTCMIRYRNAYRFIKQEFCDDISSSCDISLVINGNSAIRCPESFSYYNNALLYLKLFFYDVKV